ncbi:MAG TPA: hypothetical protein VIZ22_05180 [Candidatus Limnocylindrales bacterium]
MDAIVAALPDERTLTEQRSRLRGGVEFGAEVVREGARVIADPDRTVPDRQLMLVEGETILRFIDTFFLMREPGDTVSQACPGLAFTANAVSFPPHPSAADLGLPEQVGRFSLEPHLTRLDGSAPDLIRRLGGDPTVGRQIDVDATFGDGQHRKIVVYEGLQVDPAKFGDAVAKLDAPRGIKPVRRQVAGFAVTAFVDASNPGVSTHLASRGDRLFVFGGFSNPEVNAILAAVP